MRLDEPADFARAGQHRLNVQAGERLQFVERVDIERIAGGDDSVPFSRDSGMSVRRCTSLSGMAARRFRLDLDLGQIDEFHAELFGQGGEDVLLLGEALFDQHFVQGTAIGGVFGLQHARQVHFFNKAFADKLLNQLHGFFLWLARAKK